MHLSGPQEDLSLILSNFWEEILLKLDACAIPIVLERIQEWVGDDPQMTQVLCDYVVRYADRIDEEDAETRVDAIVQEEIIADWRNSPLSAQFGVMETSLLAYERKDSLLLAYIRLLQKGKVPLNNSPEQRVLLQAGLGKAKRGRMRVANKLYTKVFNLDWVEQQLPGITRPVAIVSTQSASSDRPSPVSKLYSKLAIAACGLAVIGAAISSYRKESGGEAMASSNTAPSALVSAEASPKIDSNVEFVEPSVESDAKPASTQSASVQPASVQSERALFDSGTEHAQNSRWVAMMREFCALPTDSAYFTPAQKRLTQWTTLYKEDIEIAKDITVQETGSSCAIADSVL